MGLTEACRPGPHGYFSWRGCGVSRCGRVLPVSASLGQCISGGLGVPGLEGWGYCRQGWAEAQRVVCFPGSSLQHPSQTQNPLARSGAPPAVSHLWDFASAADSLCGGPGDALPDCTRKAQSWSRLKPSLPPGEEWPQQQMGPGPWAS